MSLASRQLVACWKEHLPRLATADMIGVNLCQSPRLHYQGNLWLARAGCSTHPVPSATKAGRIFSESHGKDACGSVAREWFRKASCRVLGRE